MRTCSEYLCAVSRSRIPVYVLASWLSRREAVTHCPPSQPHLRYPSRNLWLRASICAEIGANKFSLAPRNDAEIRCAPTDIKEERAKTRRIMIRYLVIALLVSGEKGFSNPNPPHHSYFLCADELCWAKHADGS